MALFEEALARTFESPYIEYNLRLEETKGSLLE